MAIGIPVAGIGFIIWAIFVNNYTSFLLVYVGIIAMGINGGFFHPAMAVANNWFVKKRSTAMATISVSVGIGGSIIVPALAFIIDGWGWLTIKLSDKSGEADYNWLDQMIVDGFGRLTKYFGRSLKLTQNGVVQNYLLGGIMGLLLLIIIFQQF